MHDKTNSNQIFFVFFLENLKKKARFIGENYELLRLKIIL